MESGGEEEWGRVDGLEGWKNGRVDGWRGRGGGVGEAE